EGGLERPSILRSGETSGAAAKTAARRPAHASHSWAAGKISKERPRWMTIGAAAAVALIATLVAIQPGLIGTGKNPVSSPLSSASEAVEQRAVEKAETRRKSEAEAAAEARGMAMAEAASAEA